MRIALRPADVRAVQRVTDPAGVAALSLEPAEHRRRRRRRGAVG